MTIASIVHFVCLWIMWGLGFWAGIYRGRAIEARKIADELRTLIKTIDADLSAAMDSAPAEEEVP